MQPLAGSHMLTSVPRSVFIMTRATEQESDDRVVWFNPKNNNGEMVTRTAWHRGAEGFTPVGDFDWEEFEKSAEKSERKMVDHRAFAGALRELRHDGTGGGGGELDDYRGDQQTGCIQRIERKWPLRQKPVEEW